MLASKEKRFFFLNSLYSCFIAFIWFAEYDVFVIVVGCLIENKKKKKKTDDELPIVTPCYDVGGDLLNSSALEKV